MNIPRREYPNPQWERKDWLCLNGKWSFDFDFNRSALASVQWTINVRCI